MEHLRKRLLKLAAENPEGFTVTLPDLKSVQKGWAVSRAETQNCFGETGLQTALEVALKTSKVIGGWLNGDQFYWDAVMIFESEEAATKAGLENDQQAIYQIETGRLKWLK